MSDNQPENAIPCKLISDGKGLQCQWLNTGETRYTEPFFCYAISICDSNNGQNNILPVTTDLAIMDRLAQKLPAATPSVIIFHISRCGSTLISQMLATSNRFIMLSEVPFFDEILCLPFKQPGFDKAQVAALFHSSLKFYNAKKNGFEEHLVIKTDCWHIFFYEMLRNMFPATPFILMYRNPGEVLRSHLKMAGGQTIPEIVSPEIFGLPGIPDDYQPDTYTAAILEKMLAKFLEIAAIDNNVLLVNYNEGAIAALKKIAAFAKLDLSGQELFEMERRGRYHSKQPDQLFNKEPAAETPSFMAHAMQLYEALETLRAAK